jgi:AAA family ATP:ADP antiporter
LIRFEVKPQERRALGWSLLYVFAVLSAYYVLRPIRDAMGVQGGVENLPWLFTGTLVAMIALNPPFALLVKRLPRTRFIAWTYRFFALNLLLFALAPHDDVWVGRAFFIWLSVFNLFVVSVFWALMVDVFDSEQGKRLFGFIAAGATLGAIAGSTITVSLVKAVGTTTLFFASIVLLEIAVLAARRLPITTRTEAEEAPIGGGVLAGISHTFRSPYLLNVCLFMVLFTVTATFLYFQQAAIARDYFADRASRTAFFAQVDLLVNVLTLAIQIFFTAHILKRFGVAFTLGILPMLSIVGFAALALAPTIAVLVVLQVVRRAGNFALARPTRELLYTVLPREDKYKAKSFIDTVVYRAGDQIGSWSYLLLSSFGLGIAGIALAAVPLSAAWLGSAVWLGRRQARLALVADSGKPAVRVP